MFVLHNLLTLLDISNHFLVRGRVVPTFWKDRQYQNVDDIGIDIDMEEDIDIDTNIGIEKFYHILILILREILQNF